MKAPRHPGTPANTITERATPSSHNGLHDAAPHQTSLMSLKGLINSSPQVVQQKQQAQALRTSPHQQHLHSLQALMANPPVQLKTEIKHVADYVEVNNNGTQEKHEVGKSMEAYLDFREPVVGSATGVNWTWMQALRRQYSKANVIRGHLLNHDLGGFGVNHNLYPISTKANMEHSDKVEQLVKGQLSDDEDNLEPKRLVYKVNVLSDVAHNPAKASFECTWAHEGGSQLGKESIKSDLGTDASAPYKPKINPKVSPKDWRHGSGRGDTNRLHKTTTDYSATASPDAFISVAKSTDLQGVTVTPNVNASAQSSQSDKLWEGQVRSEYEAVKTEIINSAASSALMKLVSPGTSIPGTAKASTSKGGKGGKGGKGTKGGKSIKSTAPLKTTPKKKITLKQKAQAIQVAVARVNKGIKAFDDSKQLDIIIQSSLTRLMNDPDDILQIQKDVNSEIESLIRTEISKIP